MSGWVVSPGSILRGIPSCVGCASLVAAYLYWLLLHVGIVQSVLTQPKRQQHQHLHGSRKMTRRTFPRGWINKFRDCVRGCHILWSNTCMLYRVCKGSNPCNTNVTGGTRVIVAEKNMAPHMAVSVWYVRPHKDITWCQKWYMFQSRSILMNRTHMKPDKYTDEQ